MFNLSNRQDSQTCVLDREPVDLSNFEYLSLRVRPGDASGNAEIALQDVTSNSNSNPLNLVETAPKLLLASRYIVTDNTYVPPLSGKMLSQGQWTEVQLKICDLLQRNVDGGTGKLDRTLITKVLIDFANQPFAAAGTYFSGTRYLDIDDTYFAPCATLPCPACP